MNVPITQSEAWQNLQNDLKEESFLKQEKDFHYLAILKTTPIGNYLYLPYGPVAENKTGFKKALESLEDLAKEKSAIFIRVEPRSPEMAKILPKNARKTKDLNPKETWVLDLETKENPKNPLENRELKEKLPSRLLRYYKNMEKNGLKIETSHNPDDIKYLLNLQKALADKKGINTFSKDYLKTELSQPFATLYLVKYKNPETNKEPEIVAAGLVFDDETTRYNLQGAQSEQGRTLHATGILTIELILDAKEKGLKTFDFWGIAPENAPKNHPWAGFTAFKKTFKGEERLFAGDYDLILKPFKYKLYLLMRKFNRLIRK